MRHKKATPNRSNRVNDQIQRDVAELIRDLKDPCLLYTSDAADE